MSFKILGHRGGRKEVIYENSMEAFSHALENVDGFEADACRTADNDIFFIHETIFIKEVVYELHRHLNKESKDIIGTSRLEEISTQEASKLKLNIDNSPIPRLDTILKKLSSYPDAILNLELKGEDTAQSSVKILIEAFNAGYIKPEQVIVSSFNHSQLLQVRKLNPNIKIGVLFAGSFQPKGNLLYPWSNQDKNCYMPFERSLIDTQIIKEINPDLFNLEYTDMTADNIEYIKTLYPKSNGMTWWLPEHENHPSKDKELWSRVTSNTVKDFLYAIISDYPLEMKKYYKENYK